jgi:hypothetical protein
MKQSVLLWRIPSTEEESICESEVNFELDSEPDSNSEPGHADFDPVAALVASYVLEIKTTELMLNASSVYDGGIQTLSKVVRLSPLTSKA